VVALNEGGIFAPRGNEKCWATTLPSDSPNPSYQFFFQIDIKNFSLAVSLNSNDPATKHKNVYQLEISLHIVFKIV